MDLCTSYGFLQALSIINIVLNIAKIIVPLLLIIKLTLDIYPLISNPNNQKKVMEIVFRRILAAVIIFIIPTAIQIVLSATGDSNDASRCYNNANTSCINELKEYDRGQRDSVTSCS